MDDVAANAFNIGDTVHMHGEIVDLIKHMSRGVAHGTILVMKAWAFSFIAQSD